MNVSDSERFCEVAEAFHALAERCLSDLVDARFRLRDLLGWMRAMASRVKARGTAVDSVMRENAKKRRASDAVVRRVAEMLSSMSRGADGGKALSFGDASLSECVLGVPMMAYLAEEQPGVGLDTQSPVGLQELSGQNHKKSNGLPTKTSLSSSLTIASNSAEVLFDQPRRSLAQSLRRLDFDIIQNQKNCSNRQVFAIHKRIGLGPNDTKVDPNNESKCFLPKVMTGDEVEHIHERDWIILGIDDVAPCGSNCVQILAIPCRNSKGGAARANPPFCLSAKIILPPDCMVLDVAFYGDDGSSSLTSAADCDKGEGEEGRQALGVLIAQEEEIPQENSQLRSEELWLFRYDALPYQIITLPSVPTKKVAILNSQIKENCYITENEVGEMVILPSELCVEMIDSVAIKRRKIRELSLDTGKTSSTDAPRLVLSGSRGIGGLITNPKATLELFDLEEDEEDDSDGEDEME
uniref:Anaphase-promoting complex subunit 4 n=1 Tax=Trieres chinensis TaxID=1514140 RepID=A0A7S1ZX20_TRICV|mmetsp:Transcript_34434/g.70320  ORF Transcript_34434/g.70320 Transcript_34434/m.70320 type:complete len:467 (+) Transcript_34434:3-1403(+)